VRHPHAHSRGLPARMMEAVDTVNEAQKDVWPQDPRPFSGRGRGAGKTVAIWALPSNHAPTTFASPPRWS